MNSNELNKKWQARTFAEVLASETDLYCRIKNGDLKVSSELKKAVQNSIKELCTAILEFVEEN